MNYNKKIIYSESLSLIFLSACMILSAVISYYNNIVSFLIISIPALASFLYLWIKTGNLFNYLGLMYMGFVFVIGVANLRLAAYQKEWTVETWCCFIFAVVMFGSGYIISECVGEKKNNKSEDYVENYKGLFYFGIAICILMILAFVTKWAVARTIPLFDWNESDTYIRFMSGEGYLEKLQIEMVNYPILFKILKAWHRFSNIFSFQGWLASCLVYTYFVKGKPSICEKVIVLAVIVLSILNPILMVVREIFLMQTVSFAALAYLINENKIKRFVLVAFMVALTGFGYYSMSNSRGYSDERLADTFEMTDGGVTSWQPPVDDDANSSELEDAQEIQQPEITTSYPGIVIWLYTYFTCGFDNFNYLTMHLDFQTYGLMQLRPVFAALQIPKYKDVDELLQVPELRVSPNITIYTFLEDAYVDFRLPGVVFSLLFWGLVFGWISTKAIRNHDPVFIVIYAGIAHHVIFMFFSPWMDHFSYLCSFGLLVILHIVLNMRNRLKKVDKKTVGVQSNHE